MERILSDEGIVFRINRSIQAEGSFRDLKQDMQFRRYISKETSNVLAESVLFAMAKNINSNRQIMKLPFHEFSFAKATAPIDVVLQ